MLIVENIHSYYDKSHVLEGVSLTVNPGELVTLLGRNGAGKTTTLRSILGIICPRQGQIHFNGQALVGQKIFEIARQGLALVPENRGIFRLLTVEGLPVLLVEQNLMVCDKLADRHYVLEQGRVVYEGSAQAFRADPTIKNRYLALSA